MARLQILGNPELLRQIQEVRPFRFPLSLTLTAMYDSLNPSWRTRRHVLQRDSLSSSDNFKNGLAMSNWSDNVRSWPSMPTRLTLRHRGG